MSYEREEDAITEAYNNGEISLEQHNQELRDLQRSYKGMHRTNQTRPTNPKK
jgi:hypothetical protein